MDWNIATDFVVLHQGMESERNMSSLNLNCQSQPFD